MTSEKVLISCSQEQCKDIQGKLNDKFGGEWVLVDSIDPFFEILHFDDGLVYDGFDPSIERYSTAIDSILENSCPNPFDDIISLLKKSKNVAIVSSGNGVHASFMRAAIEAAAKEVLFIGCDAATGNDITVETVRSLSGLPPLIIKDDLAKLSLGVNETFIEEAKDNRPFYMGALDKKGGKKSKKR